MAYSVISPLSEKVGERVPHLIAPCAKQLYFSFSGLHLDFTLKVFFNYCWNWSEF